jgi:hypothetical protein
MLYFSAPGRYLRHTSPAAEWGKFVMHVEIGEDRHAARQVWTFRSGQVLRYDRDHWCDDFGQLLGLLFSRQPRFR